MARMSRLLDEALLLDEAGRCHWLEALSPEYQDIAEALREALLPIGDGALPVLASLPKFGDDPSVADSSRLEAGARVGPYNLIKPLGAGGMGQVWLAEQTTPVRRLVALKLIKAGMYDETVVQRFQAERQSLAIMDHPAIAKVFDAGATTQGQPYLVMEYVPGLPIIEYCDRYKLNVRKRIELFIQACDGVQHAHQKAIIHRDLKPANILVIEVDGKPVPRIIDFGLAKATAARLAEQTLYTRFGQFLGTPGYMSPEQVDPNIRDIDTRTDVYSLGVILYVLLTGLQPFETKRPQRPPLDVWVRQLREEEPPSMSAKVNEDRESAFSNAVTRSTEPKQLVHTLRGDLDCIAMKALERDRTRRYGTPSELAGDLGRYLNEEPVLARPASAAYQLHKFIRRHRVGAVSTAMLTILAIVASGAGLIAVRQKHEAQFQADRALQAQSQLLIQAAAQRLKDSDVVGAQRIILEVLTNPGFPQGHTPVAMSLFQEVRAADAQLAVLSGHADIVLSAAYSPDGSRIVTASQDKTARIWDARLGKQLTVLSAHSQLVRTCVYSPDGSRIVTASDDKTARIWDARTGAQLAVLSGHGDRVYSAAYSPDGRRIVTASEDKTVRIWDAATGVQLAVLSGHEDRVNSATYSPDGTRIVTASQDKTARIWDAHLGKQLTTLFGHGATVGSAVYSPDGTRVVTASLDRTARIWDARSGKQLAVLSGRGSVVSSAAYSPDGTHIVTASVDKTARIWDALTGAQLAVLSGHGEQLISASYSPDGTRIVTASYDSTARIWDARTGAQVTVLSGDRDVFRSAAFSPDGTHIVTASVDKTARIWDARSGKQLAVMSGHDSPVGSAAYSPDGTRIVTASLDKTARIWDARTGAQLAVLSGHDNVVASAAYSPDAARIVTASPDKTARIWDAGSGKQLALLSGHGSVVSSAAYSPDGTCVVTASSDKTARIWDARSGTQLTVLSGHGDRVFSAAYSPDGRRVVTAAEDKTARIWDARSGKQLALLSGHSSPVASAAYSPDGTRIVTASWDGTARIWDARSGKQLAVLSGHLEELTTAAYSPDGTRIVTASDDKTARIWDARVPASIEAQIVWDSAAQTDPVQDAERTQLGLPRDARVRLWSTAGTDCDQAASAVYDPDRLAPGALLENINVDIANSTCSEETAKPDHAARLDYEMGRTLFAKGNVNGAKHEFELAVSNGYRAARIDLAGLLVDPIVGMLDPERALLIYKEAWRDGVPIAAFELGHLYEYGVRGSGAATVIQPDQSEAWFWYQKGADAGESNSLARFAERDEAMAATEADLPKRNADLLHAFSYFAAASERAHDEDWPDDAWKHWRYRRATLARLLAREGLMQQVADAYKAICDHSIL